MPRGSKPGEHRGGRKKGQPNHLTAAIKDSVVKAFDQLGGVNSLVQWADKNKTEFYKLWGRMAPTEVNAAVDGALTIRVVRE